MSEIGSVTHWIQQLKSGERAEVHNLWERYFHQLVAIARSKLQTFPRTAADEEDVAISAFHSFCKAVEGGRFPKLDDRHDVWQILIMITRRKAISLKQYERREIRDCSRNQAFSDETMAGPDFKKFISSEPDPQFVSEMVDQCTFLMNKLDDDRLSQIVRWRMDGYTIAEIGEKLDLSPATIERRMRFIRKCWLDEAEK